MGDLEIWRKHRERLYSLGITNSAKEGRLKKYWLWYVQGCCAMITPTDERFHNKVFPGGVK